MRYEQLIAMPFLVLAGAILGSTASSGAATTAAASAAADTVYRNGSVYTVDAHDSMQQALAIRGGRASGARGVHALAARGLVDRTRSLCAADYSPRRPRPEEGD